MEDEKLGSHGVHLGKVKLDQKAANSNLGEVPPPEGPKAYTDKRPHTCQPMVTIWPRNPHHAGTYVGSRQSPGQDVRWGSS